jgi:hypothetical protein
VPFVSLAGQSLCRDSSAVSPGGCLQQLKQIPAHALLFARRRAAKLDISTIPEGIKVLPLCRK